MSAQHVLIYPFPMHFSQGFTYHLSILQFLQALSQFIEVRLLCLDTRTELAEFYEHEFHEPLADNFHVVTVSQKRWGIKSNRFWFYRNVIGEVERLSRRNVKVTIYSRNVKQMAQTLKYRANRSQQVRCLFECHQLYSQNLACRGEFAGGLREFKLETRINTAADHVFVNTRPLAHQIKRLFGRMPTVLPVATRSQDLTDPAQEGNDYASRPYDFVYAGSFGEWKGVDALFEAFAILRHAGWAGRALCVGVREAERLDVERNLKVSGASQCVDLVGKVPRADVASYLDQARVGVLPNSLMEDSVFNTSPLKLYDYAARGLSICATRLPALDGAIHDEAVTWARPDDPGDLATKLSHALQNADDLNYRAIAWVGELTWEKRAERVLKVIHEVWA